MNREQDNAQRRQEGTMHVSGIQGAEETGDRLAGRSEGESDLRLPGRAVLRVGIELGKEEATIAQALNSVEPGDLVMYHRGIAGSAPASVSRAAVALYDQGLCLLTQRVTGERDARGERIFEYLAVKKKPDWRASRGRV